MKNILHYIALLFLIVFLANPVLGFQGMSINNSTEQPDLSNITESDQDIIIRQHLIEVDAIQLKSLDKLYVRETITFKNTGNMNFMGYLRTWIPDGTDEIRIGKIEMTMGAMPEPLPMAQNGNIISWQDFLVANDPLPNLYVVEYSIPLEPEGALTKTQSFKKKLSYPTLINYRYEGRSGLPAVVIKITKSEDESLALKDENKNKLNPTEMTQEDNSIINRFESPQFKEVNIEISKAAITPTGIAGYVILGLLIILAISYPVIRKKSEPLQAFEEKIRNSLKREPQEEETEEEIIEGVPEETLPAEPEIGEYPEFEGKTRDELESIKSETTAKLDELQKEYESGNLLDEEYEELRKPHQEKLEKVTKKLEQAG